MSVNKGESSRSSGLPPLQQSGSQSVDIPLGRVWLQGELTLPATPQGMVLFAHGSGSSRFSARNQFVASALNQAGFATCLFDLLSLDEEQEDQVNSRYRFDIPMLGQRLIVVTDWLEQHLDYPLPIGYFGASTGAAAALLAASERPYLVKAVVSRGGRPDMAMQALHRIQAPTLLLVGGLDSVVLELNRQAFRQLPVDLPKELVVIAGAGHLFEESGKLAQVSQYAAQWFTQYLTASPSDQ